MQLRWQLSTFNELTQLDLYRILQLRNQIFIVEQNDIYLDPDDKDLVAFHLIAWDKDSIAAYARILPPESTGGFVSFGRVAVAETHRGAGIAQELIKRVLDKIVLEFPHHPVKIAAQSYLIKFYERFGFQIKGEEFLEGTIPHIYMVKS